jgi:hypothetical protein
MDAPEKELLDRLQTLARGTEDVRPTNDFSDAIMAAIEPKDADDIVEKARNTTAEIAPTDDFVASVMRNIEQTSGNRSIPENDWNAGILRFSRFALAGAAAAAVLCLWLSSQAESRFDATILEDVAALEVDE